MMKASFKPHGQARLDRLDQDETQRLCSLYHNGTVPKDVAAKIEAAVGSVLWADEVLVVEVDLAPFDGAHERGAAVLVRALRRESGS